MPIRPTVSEKARCITLNADLVADIVDEILHEAAWWTAVRSRKFAQRTIVWADRRVGETPARKGARCAPLRPGALRDVDR